MAGARRAGGISRRCECRGEDGKKLRGACPQLAKRGHGTWRLVQELPADEEGRRRRFERTGYATSTEAQKDLDDIRAILGLAQDERDKRRVGDLLAAVSKQRLDLPGLDEVKRKLRIDTPVGESMTMGRLLTEWLELKRNTRRRTTVHGYEGHVRNYLLPLLGHYRTDRLGVPHAQRAFDEIREQNRVIAAQNEERREQVERCRWPKRGRPPAAERERLAKERARLAEMPPFRRTADVPTQHAIRRTLHIVLEYGIGRQAETGLTLNVARYIDLAPYRRPKGLLWTSQRVARWRETGLVPGPVMVWNPQQLGQFLDAAEERSRFYAAYRLIGYHGLRRSEVVGEEWTNLDEESATLEILTALTVDGWEPYEDAPKTEESAAPVKLDRGTVDALRRHRVQQLVERDEWNAEAARRRSDGEKDVEEWTDSGKIFTRPDGKPIHPEELSDDMRRLIAEEDLPPVTLRDVRHVVAGLVKACGGDIDAAMRKLRHSTIVLTADTYMPLFEELEEGMAQDIVDVVPRKRRMGPGRGSGEGSEEVGGE